MRSLMIAILIAFATAPAIAQDSEKPVKEEKEFKPPSGYTAKMRGDETVYCRKQIVLGSRLPQELCFNELQLKELERRKKSMQEDVAQRQRMCSTGSACSGGG